MSEQLHDHPIPATDEQVNNLVNARFRELVGVDVTQRLPESEERVYLERFAHSGMASGVVDVRWWRDKLIPLLVKRAAQRRSARP